jgi:hypothetical protein
MQTKRIILVSLLITSFTFSVLSQSDYRSGKIVLLNGDTVHGLVNYSNDESLTKECSFKTTKNDKSKKYFPNEINSYSFDNEKRKFISDSINYQEYSLNCFLEVVVDGYLNLYKIVQPGAKELFFLRKNGSKQLVYIPFEKYLQDVTDNDKRYNTTKTEWYVSTNHIDTLKKYMSEAPEIYPEIENTKEVTQASLIRLFKLYHKQICKTSICIEFEKKNKPVRFDITPSVMYLIPGNRMYPSTNRILGGCTAALGLFKNNERLYMAAGIYFYKSESESKLYHIIPLQFLYLFPQKTIQPFFAAGVSFSDFIGDYLEIGTILTFKSGLNFWFTKNIALSISVEPNLITPFSNPEIYYGFLNLYAGCKIKF